MIRLPGMLKRREKPVEIPEAATEEPRTLTPAEDAERATRNIERQERRGESLYPAPADPGRQGGESSPPPDKRR